MATIGIMGSLVSNENMGCVALTYSLIKMLERISNKAGLDFSYIIFEYEKDEERYRLLSQNLGVEINKIKYAPIGFFDMSNLKLVIKKMPTNLQTIFDIRKCDLVIDLTQGDSFTDIYGLNRFESLTNVKRLVQMFKVPLILGPQTYGPFLEQSVKAKAKIVIDRAVKVISRDQESEKYLSEFCDKPVIVATDLAFALPYSKDNTAHDKIRVGINPSGLLVKSKTEHTDLKTGLTTDYDTYIQKLISTLALDGQYEIHLIPHVGNDAVKQYSGMPGVIAHTEFKTPIEAKNCIASMDVFIGARMHATIGAFSAGVATIPTAYSRKFSGLFRNIGYNHVLDLTVLETDEALQKTLDMIDSYKELQQEVEQCMVVIQDKLEILRSCLSDTIHMCLKKSNVNVRKSNG